jgi:hypothetical protein
VILAGARRARTTFRHSLRRGGPVARARRAWRKAKLALVTITATMANRHMGPSAISRTAPLDLATYEIWLASPEDACYNAALSN